jgi:hypothetical protein
VPELPNLDHLSHAQKDALIRALWQRLDCGRATQGHAALTDARQVLHSRYDMIDLPVVRPVWSAMRDGALIRMNTVRPRALAGRPLCR